MRIIILFILITLISCTKPRYTAIVTFVSTFQLEAGETIVVLIDEREVGRIKETTDTKECYNPKGFTYELEEGTYLIHMHHSQDKVAMMKRIKVEKEGSCIVVSI